MSDKQDEKPVEVKYLRPDNSAECPVDGYTGTIRFPLVMTLAMHKRWQTFVNERAGRDSDAPRIGIAFDADAVEAADSGRLVFVYDDVELALMFGELDLTGPDGKKLKPSDDWPLPLAVWAAKCYREWENSRVTFRWSGAGRVAASDE